MSIKINGTDNTITKEGGSKVIVVPSLYLNNTEITASGGGSVDPGDKEKVCEFKTCGVYAASKYAGYDKVKVNVSNWETVENIPDNYYEINSNREYNISQFAGYAGIVVTKKSGGEDPSTISETIYFNNVFIDPASGSSTSIQSKTLTNTIDENNYSVKYTYAGSISAIAQVNTAVKTEKWNTTIDSSKASAAEGWASYQFEIKNNNTVSFSAWMEEVKLGSTIFTPSSMTCSNVSITITQTPKTSSTLSLRQTSPSRNDMFTVENLIVNNDALIQGNLSVNGYINDLLWYWDSIAVNAIETYLGIGFLAKITDLTFKLNSEQVLIPTLQLSPGSLYKENSYSIIWTSTGMLKINADNITEISGLIQVLRYE